MRTDAAIFFVCFALLGVVTGFSLINITLVFNIGVGVVIYFRFLKVYLQSKGGGQLCKHCSQLVLLC